jgi:putative membrane protein
LLPLVGGLGAVADDVLGQDAQESLVDRLPTDTVGVLALIAAVLFAAWLLSFLGSLVAFAGFSVVRDGDNLRIHRGFLQRRATSVPLRRVHAVSVAEGPLRRPLGLCSVRLETAGYGKEPAAARTLFPLIRLTDVDARLATFVPALAPTPAPAGSIPSSFERPPTRAARRYILPATLTAALLATALTLAWPSAWPIIPLLTALAALDGLARYRSAGWRLDGDRILLRRGSLTRRTLVALPTHLQDHAVSQNDLQRRAKLANLSITVASGAGSTVAHLDSRQATGLFDRLRPAA